MDEKDIDDKTTDTPADESEAKSAISADLIRGHINTIILRTLYERDKYGYEIIEEIEKKSHGQYSLKQPTLYSALKRLESQGYINAYWKTDEVSLGGRRKYYTLTDRGREITEKNQAEWEYSRTVIDSLISDRSFDFSMPAPSPVDFKLLKKSTSRVPVLRDDESDEEVDDDVKEEISAVEKHEGTQQVVQEETVIVQQAPSAPASPVQAAEPAMEQPQAQVSREMSAAERRLVHENYMRLISEPAPAPAPEPEVMPGADQIDTEKLLYNNRPETERDYRNLINALFNKTVTRPAVVAEPPAPAPVKPKAYTPDTKSDDLATKAEVDGLKVSSSKYVVNSNRKSYNLGGTLLKCSLIVAVVMLLEFVLCILLKKELGISLAYPFVIFAIAVAQLAIFGVLYYTDVGKIMRRPSTSIYLTACFIATIVLIALIFLISILLKVNFASVSDIFRKIIIPIFVALNIPIFAVGFYALSK